MGEYAIRKSTGDTVKIGSTQHLWGLRPDQLDQITPTSTDGTNVAAHIGAWLFRFPFPDEDTHPAGDFEDWNRTVPVPGTRPPAGGIDHSTVQFRSNYPREGLLVSLPCPEGPEHNAGLTIHRNGFQSGVRLVAQRVWEGRLVLVAECASCGCKWRYETAQDVAPVLEAIDLLVAEDRNPHNRYRSETRGKWWETVAQRIRSGYDAPPSWAVETAPAAPAA